MVKSFAWRIADLIIAAIFIYAGVLKVLNRALVFLGCRLCLKGSQIPALSCLRIFLPRIQPIFTGLELPDHAVLNQTS